MMYLFLVNFYPSMLLHYENFIKLLVFTMRVDFLLYNILRILAFLLALAAMFPEALAANNSSKNISTAPLILSTGTHPAVVNYYEPLVKKAYQQLEIPIEFLSVNEERSLLLLEAGEIDGDTIRTKSVLKNYDSFIPVYMMGVADVYIICQPNIECNRSILQKRDHFLGTVAGSAYFDDSLKNAKITLLKYTNYELLKSSFHQKRVDAYIDVISSHYTTRDIPENAGILHFEKIYGYHILHKKHKHLAEKVAAKLKELQRIYPNPQSTKLLEKP